MTLAVERALSLLDLFSESCPEVGLSDAARLSGHDKATVHRLLKTLCDAELVEQDARTRAYRLGPAVLRLARVRERTVPLVSIAQPLLDTLSRTTGETAHLSLYTGNALVVIAASESTRQNHVSLRRSEVLPLHATASGQAFLAFAPSETRASVLSRPMEAFTASTPKTAEAVERALDRTRTSGHAFVEKSYDDDVCGVAVPIFGADGTTAIGALAVASPCHRMTGPIRAQIIAGVEATASELRRRMGFKTSAGR